MTNYTSTTRYDHMYGRRFGAWTVIGHLAIQGTMRDSRTGKQIDKVPSHWKWLCICDCGETGMPLYNNLVAGKSRGCHACAVGNHRRTTSYDLHNSMYDKRFGSLKVVGHLALQDEKDVSKWKWLCVCDCGETCTPTANKLRTNHSTTCGLCCRRLENHHNWVTDRSLIRDTKQPWVPHWRNAVFRRDRYTCQSCGERGKQLNAHHVYSWKHFPERRIFLDTGITLCIDCHVGYHGWNGGYNVPATKESFEQWLKERVL